MPPIIEVNNLNKVFRTPVKKKGFLTNLFNPEFREIMAVKDLSFSVQKGEILAFLGPNGAGKSTTIKMLTGILYPTSGRIQVDGFSPQKQRQEYVRQIGTVFGQKSQLLYNLPLQDSLRLFGKIFELEDKTLDKRIAYLSDLLSIDSFVDQPVRKLSLGQRMRGEIAASLIHNPKLIFLDEPTIGLDVVAKRNLRQSLKNLNQTQETTIFLTSHDTGDIDALAERTIFINKGEIIIDKPTKKLKKEYLNQKTIKIKFAQKVNNFNFPVGKIIKQTEVGATLLVELDKHDLNTAINYISNNYRLRDIDVFEPDLEEIITNLYEKIG